MKNGDAINSNLEPTNTDVIEKSIGILGRWQLWVCFIIYLTKFAVAWHQMNIVFLAPKIDFHCANTSINKCSSRCTEYIYDTSVFTNTITSQWNLICGRQYLESLAQTLAMLGILIGSMAFGYLSDRYGRRNALVAAITLQGICGLGEAFSPWLWLFLIMRFLTSTATGGTMVTGFVLVMEIVGSKWRTLAGVLYQIPFSIGHMLMPLISYWLRDWRYFIVATSAPSLLLISYYWILPESPRWQLAVGKKQEATRTLIKAAVFNKLPSNTIEQEINKYLENKNVVTGEQHKGNILDLLRTPIIRTYTIVLWLNWIFVSFSFFGANQMMGQLGGDIFLNVSLPGAIGIPGILLSYWGVEHWGRKKTLIFGNTLAGITLIVTAIVPSYPTWIKTVIASVGISALMLSFTTIYIYAGEVFPTVVRNVGLGSSSTWARVGSMVAPFIATLATQPWVVPVIFGVVILLSAGLCIKLPETLHCKLPETVEEVEQFEMNKR